MTGLSREYLESCLLKMIEQFDLEDDYQSMLKCFEILCTL